jgi:hypothetical protein
MVEQQQWTGISDTVSVTAPRAEVVATEAAQNALSDVRTMQSLPNITIAAVGDSRNNTPRAFLTDRPPQGKYPMEKPAFESLARTEAPLTNQETFMLNSLRNSIKSGNLQETVDALAALSDNMDSAHRVLTQLRKDIEGKGTSVTFQTGKDQDNKPVVQLQINRVFGDNLRASNHEAHLEPSHVQKLQK